MTVSHLRNLFSPLESISQLPSHHCFDNFPFILYFDFLATTFICPLHDQPRNSLALVIITVFILVHSALMLCLAPGHYLLSLVILLTVIQGWSRWTIAGVQATALFRIQQAWRLIVLCSQTQVWEWTVLFDVSLRLLFKLSLLLSELVIPLLH